MFRNICVKILGTLRASGNLRLARFLSGANASTGTLNVNGGRVIVGGSVQDGGGTSTINLTNATLSAGGSIGVLTSRIDNLYMENSALVLNVTGDTTNVAVTTLTTAGAGNTIAIGQLPPITVVPTQMVLVAYTTLAGSGYNFNLSPRLLGYLSNNAANSSIDLVITNLAVYDSIKWAGTVNGDWDINTTANWKDLSGNDSVYGELSPPGDAVIFDDTANTFNVNVTAPVSPAVMQFNNATANYVLSGSGRLSGPGALSKDGNGSLTLNLAGSDYLGSTIINGGALRLGGGDQTLPAGTAVTLADVPGVMLDLNNSSQTIVSLSGGGAAGGNVLLGDGTLTLNPAINTVFNGAFSGSGDIVKNNNNVLTLGGASPDFSGTITANAGQVVLATSQAAGSGSTIYVNSATGGAGMTGTRVTLTNNITVNDVAISLPSNGSPDYRSTFYNPAGNTSVWNGLVIARGSGNINVGGPGNLTLNGRITNDNFSGWLLLRDSGLITVNGQVDLGQGVLTVVDGASVAQINSTGNYWKEFQIRNARAILGAHDALCVTGLVTLGQGTGTDSGRLDLNGFNQQIARVVTVNTNGTHVITNGGAADSILTYTGPASSYFIGFIRDNPAAGSGKIALDVTGGSLTLAKTSTYSGNTFVGAGASLVVGTNNALPSGAGRGRLTVNGILDLGGFNQAVNDLAGNGLVDNTAGTGAYTLTLGGADATGHFSGTIQNTSGTISLTKTNSGTNVLSGNNTFAGNVTVSAGVLNVRNSGALGVGPKIVTIAGSTPELQLDGPNLVFPPELTFRTSNDGGRGPAALRNISGNNEIQGRIELVGGGGSSYYSADGGTLTLSGMITNTYTATRALTLAGAAQGVINGVITDGTGAGVTTTVDKRDAGTWTLNAANLYTGNTLVGGGTLALGAGGSIAGSQIITLANDAVLDASAVAGGLALGANQKLQGQGAIAGSLVQADAGNVLSPGSDTVAGTLTISNNLTLAGGVFRFNLSGTNTPGAGVNDLLIVGGDVDLSAPTTLDLVFLAASPQSPAAYTLIKYAGSFTGDPANLVAPTNPRYTYTVTNNPVLKEVQLLVSGSGGLLTWLADPIDTGDNPFWDVGTTLAWLNTGEGEIPDYFYAGDHVLFNDMRFESSTNVNIPGTVVPASVTVDSTGAYVFGGVGKISGGTALTKQNSGVLVINTTNDYLGLTTIDGGLVQIGAPGALGGTNAGTIINGGALDLNNLGVGYEPITAAGAGPDGNGAIVNLATAYLTVDQVRSLTLTGDTTVGGWQRWDLTGLLAGNGYRLTKKGTNEIWIAPTAGDTGLGDIEILEGVLGFEGVSSNILGNPAATLSIASGAALGFYGLNNTNDPMNKVVTMNQGRWLNDNGNNYFAGAITLAGSNTFSLGGGQLHLQGAISGDGALRKTGTGQLHLHHGGNNWTGGTFVEQGTLYAYETGALPGSVLNNGMVAFIADIGETINNSSWLSGTGQLVSSQYSQGLTVYAGTNECAGGTLVTAGHLQIDAGGLLTGGNVTVNGGQLTLGGGGSIFAQSFTVAQNVTTGTVVALPGGTLSIGQGAAHDWFVGYRTAQTVNATNVLMDVSALESLTANVNRLYVGYNSDGNGSGDRFAHGLLYLATNNNIIANQIVAGYSIANWTGRTNWIVFGSGSNNVQTTNFIVAGLKEHAAIRVPAGGTLILNNGVDRANLRLSLNQGSTGSNPLGLFDASEATVVASLDTLQVALKNGGGVGAAQAEVHFGPSPLNNINANNVIVADMSGGATGAGVTRGLLSFGGGTMTVNNNVTLGVFGGTIGGSEGTLQITGGLFQVAGDIVDGSANAAAISTLVLDGGALDMQPAGDASPGAIGSAANPINNLSLLSGTLMNVGELNGGAPLTKAGAGTLTLAGVNTYTGGTVVNEGTLLVNGVVGSPVTVNGGILGGNGVINAPVTVQAGGALEPGASIGALTINNTLALGGVLRMELNRTNLLNSDRLAGVTTLTLGGALVVTNIGEALMLGDVFKLFDAANYSGVFALVELPALAPGLTWNTSRLTVEGIIFVTTAAAAPVAVPDAFTVTMNQTTGLATAKLLLNDSDPGSNPIGFWSASLYSAQGGVITVAAGQVQYTPPAGFLGQDQFHYSITNTLGGADVATVTLLVQAPGPVPNFNQLAPPFFDAGSGTAVIRFAGIPFRDYLLYRSTNLPVWTVISTNTAPSYGLIDFVDPNAPPVGPAFYKTAER